MFWFSWNINRHFFSQQFENIGTFEYAIIIVEVSEGRGFNKYKNLKRKVLNCNADNCVLNCTYVFKLS